MQSEQHPPFPAEIYVVLDGLRWSSSDCVAHSRKVALGRKKGKGRDLVLSSRLAYIRPTSSTGNTSAGSLGLLLQAILHC